MIKFLNIETNIKCPNKIFLTKNCEILVNIDSVDFKVFKLIDKLFEINLHLIS